MIKEIVPYEESLALSQIGFVQSCWCAYHDLTWPSKEDKHKLETVHSLTSYMESHAHQYINPVLAPTYSQAFRWFRDNGKVVEIFSQLLPSNKYKWGFKIQGVEGITDGFFTYEEAELACLKKLIEIVKTQ
jgi:hypothetical protein